MATELVAFLDKDTFRKHRYLIEEKEGISGSIYLEKDTEVPKELTIKLRVKEIDV